MKKYVTLLGLAAVTAMAVMAFAGAGSASATVLCKTTVTPCPEGWDYGAGTKVDASLEPGSTAVLETSGGGLEDTCSESTVKGEQENTGSTTETVKVTVTELTFGKCTKPTKVIEGHGTLEFHWIEGTHDATVTAIGFEVTVEAISGVSCVYTAGAATDLGVGTSGSMGTIDVSAVVKKKSGAFLCPASSVWTASYTITEPEPIYVVPSSAVNP
jgi:hypothetical protein